MLMVEWSELAIIRWQSVRFAVVSLGLDYPRQIEQCFIVSINATLYILACVCVCVCLVISSPLELNLSANTCCSFGMGVFCSCAVQIRFMVHNPNTRLKHHQTNILIFLSNLVLMHNLVCSKIWMWIGTGCRVSQSPGWHGCMSGGINALSGMNLALWWFKTAIFNAWHFSQVVLTAFDTSTSVRYSCFTDCPSQVMCRIVVVSGLYFVIPFCQHLAWLAGHVVVLWVELCSIRLIHAITEWATSLW